MVTLINALFTCSLILGLISMDKAVEQAHLFPCFTYGHCKEDLDGKHKENWDECLAGLKKEDFETLSNKMSKAGYTNFKANALPQFRDKYCAFDEEKMEEVFNELITIGVEEYTKFCTNPMSASECDRANHLMACGCDNLDEMHNDGLC